MKYNFIMPWRDPECPFTLNTWVPFHIGDADVEGAFITDGIFTAPEDGTYDFVSANDIVKIRRIPNKIFKEN